MFSLAHHLVPDDVTACAFLSDQLSRTGRQDKSEPLSAGLRSANHTDPVVAAVLALDSMRRYNYPEARKLLQEAIAGDTNDHCAELHILLAKTLTRQGFTGLAQKHYLVAARICRNHYQSLLLEARAQHLAGDLRQEEQSVRAAGAILPDDPLWHTYLASVLLVRNDVGEASNQLKAAVRCKRLYGGPSLLFLLS